MDCHGASLVLLGIAAPERVRLLERQPGGDITVEGVMGARLVREHVRYDVPLHDPRQHFGAVPHEPHTQRLAGRGRPGHPFQGLVQVASHPIAVSGVESAADPLRIHFHAQHGRPVHGPGKRLRAAHSSHPARKDPLALEAAVELLPGHGAEGLVRALEDPLGADVDPGSGGHLPVHHQALALQLTEMVPRRPAAHQVAVGDQHARGVRVRPENPHWLA